MDHKQTETILNDNSTNHGGRTSEQSANSQTETRQQENATHQREIAALEAKLNALSEQYLDLNNKYNALQASNQPIVESLAYPEKLPDDRIPAYIKQIKKDYYFNN